MIPQNLVRNVSGGTTALSPTDLFVSCDTSGSQVILILPTFASIQAALAKSGVPQSEISIRVADISGNASVNPIKVYAGGGENISGDYFVEINSNNGTMTFTISANGIWSSGGGASTPPPTPVNVPKIFQYFFVIENNATNQWAFQEFSIADICGDAEMVYLSQAKG